LIGCIAEVCFLLAAFNLVAVLATIALTLIGTLVRLDSINAAFALRPRSKDNNSDLLNAKAYGFNLIRTPKLVKGFYV